MTILFELDFPLEWATRESYEEFIKQLREKLKKRSCNNRPVLAYQEMLPTQFFDVVVRTNSHSVRFRFRADNLYLVGYQMETRQWLELDNDESENKNQKSKSKKNKSKSNSNEGVHMITERGTEFLRFSGDYGSLQTLEDMLTVIGILLGLCITPTPSKRGRHRRSITSGSEMCFWGSLLVQVFSVRIDNIDNENPGDLYGTITIENGIYKGYIYNCSSDNPESIKPGECATLTGPSKPMPALGNFTIKLLLKDKDTFLSIDRLNPDEVIVDDDISWKNNAYYDNLYDELISCNLRSERGEVTVNYAVLTDCVAAQISITLEQGGESSCEVYGHASLTYDSWELQEDTDSTTCLLFERSGSNYVEVPRWELIPLLRSVFAVPLDTSLDLSVRFSDHDTISGDDLIAEGTVKLSPPGLIPSTTYNKITGEDGNYVSVTTRWTFAV